MPPFCMGAPFTTGSVAAFDLSSVRLSGWWQAGNYTTGTPTWTSSPSAGDSGTRPAMVQWLSDSVPTLGTALNGHAPASFTPDSSGGGNNGNFLVNNTASISGLVDSLGKFYTFGCIVDIRSAITDPSPEYKSPLIFGDTNEFFCIMARTHVTTPQIVLFQWDGAAKYVEQNCSFGQYIAVWGTYDNGTGIMKLDVGGGIGTTSGVGAIQNVSFSAWMGGVHGTDASRRADMLLADFAIARFAGEFTRAQYVSYANARYGLSLT